MELPDNVQFLGEFKLKDKPKKGSIRITFEDDEVRTVGNLKYLDIYKKPGANNRFRVFVTWREKDENKSPSK